MIRQIWRRAGPWLTPVLVVVEVALVWSGLLPLGTAVLLGVACEALLWATAISRVVAGIGRARAGRAAGLGARLAAEPAVTLNGQRPPEPALAGQRT